MRFLLDTNIVSAYLKGDQRVFNRFIQHSGGLSTSTICAGELYSWVGRKNMRATYRSALDDALVELPLLPVDHDVARKYGEVRAALLDQGRPTPEVDLFIACTALAHDLTLVTRNVADFGQIPGLRIENWLA
jgi:tRNA(fMet)-specific endonuclease VapC